MSRLRVPEVFPGFYRAMAEVEKVLHEAPLDHRVRELVKIRASQLNGCLRCIDMHVHDALKQGESPERIYQLPAWRESELYTDAERAALAYAEAVTAQPDAVSDEVWNAVTAAFKPEEAAALVAQLAMINAWNRISAPMHMRPPRRS
jgi:AhpD family alkylhydroperoxidase